MNEELKVSIKAEVANFKKGVQQASKELENFKKENDKTVTSLDKLKTSIKSQEDKLASLKDEYTNVVLEQGEHSKAAKAIKKEIISLNKALESNKTSLDNAEMSTNKLAKSLNRGQEAAKAAGEKCHKAGESIKKGMAIGAGAIAATGTALVALSGTTEEYRNAQGKLNTAFETAGSSADTAYKTYSDLQRVLGDSGQAVEAANHLAKLTTNEKELSQWTDICQGIYGTFGESIPIEGLTEAVNETAKVGQVTGGLADALNWAGVNEDDFNAKLEKCNSEAEREKLIRETLNGLYSDASKNYEKNNADILKQNESQEKLNKVLGELGETMSPVVTMLADFANDTLSTLSPYIQEFAENYLPVIQPILQQIAEAIGITTSFLIQHPALLGTIAGVIASVVAVIGLYNAVAAVKNAMDAAQVTSLGALISAQMASAGATMLAIAPYVAVVAAIAAVIAIIVVCIKYWDEIAEACKKAWDKVCEWCSIAKDWIVETFNKVVDWFKENWQGLLLLLLNPFAGAFKLIYDNCEGFRTKVDDFISKTKTAFKTGFEKVKESILTPIHTARDKVKEALDKMRGFFKFDWSLPKLKMPHFKITGDFSLNPPSAPKFDISWYKNGGVFDKPTLFGYGSGSLGGLGENGAEAVVPLENNLGWLDKLATMLNERQGNTPIVLTVDGKVLAQTSIDSINALTRQTGSLPLVLG